MQQTFYPVTQTLPAVWQPSSIQDTRTLSHDLRIGDLDRKTTCSLLHRHYTEGRLSQSELEERIAAVARAQYHSELLMLTQDLPLTTQRHSNDFAGRIIGETLLTLVAICAAFCLFIMMIALGASRSPSGFVPASLAILATSVITSTACYWVHKSKMKRALFLRTYPVTPWS